MPESFTLDMYSPTNLRAAYVLDGHAGWVSLDDGVITSGYLGDYDDVSGETSIVLDYRTDTRPGGRPG